MASSGVCRRIDLLRTDISEERIPTLITVLVIVNVVSSTLILSTVMMEVISFSETLVLTIATRHHIPEDCILHSHRREYLKSYIELTGWGL
jgi:hypothetical protein